MKFFVRLSFLSIFLLIACLTDKQPKKPVHQPETKEIAPRKKADKITSTRKNWVELKKKAYHTYKKLPDTVLKNRLFLKNLMKKYGLASVRTEWWHYLYRKKSYPVGQWVWECDK